jgi:prevent-host-death family protein
MLVNATEFKNRVGKYLEIAEREEVIILKNGKKIAKLIQIEKEDAPITKSLIGILKNKDINLDQTKEERLKKYENPT